jgi:hypothetical protein
MPTTAYDDIIDEIENEIKCGGFNKQHYSNERSKHNNQRSEV